MHCVTQLWCHQQLIKTSAAAYEQNKGGVEPTCGIIFLIIIYKQCMYSSVKCFMCPWEGYCGVYFPYCTSSVCLESSNIILFLTWHNESINGNKSDNLDTSTLCLTHSAYILLMMTQSIANLLMTWQWPTVCHTNLHIALHVIIMTLHCYCSLVVQVHIATPTYWFL